MTACWVAACDDGEDRDDGIAGKSAGGKAGSSGSPGSSGSTSAGTGGTMTPEGGMGGQETGGGGSGGTMGGDAGAGGQAGAAAGEAGAAGAGGARPLEDIVRERLVGTSPLPAVPADPTNMYADNAAAATFGQRLFFDEKFSGPLKIDSDLGTAPAAAKVSCNSCHSGPVLDDERSQSLVSIGTGLHTRNAPAMVNSSFYEWTNWGGRFAAQWELPLPVTENGVIMNGNRLAVAHRIFDFYKADYEAIFGALTPEIGTDPVRFPPAGKPKALPTDADGAWELMAADDRTIIMRIMANYSKSLAAYTRKLVSREAAFDLFMAGDDAAMTETELRGALVFVDKGCGTCHGGPHFSDGEFHQLGVPQTGMDVPAMDDGRFKDTPPLLTSTFNINSPFSDKTDTGKLAGLTNPAPESFKGAFRTPSLRGSTLSAPYMHSGQLATLSDVIDFYVAGGTATTAAGELDPVTISDEERAQLIAFLGTLNGKAVAPALLVDTAAN